MESSVSQTASLQAFSETLGDRSVEVTAISVDTGEIWFRGTDVASSLGYLDPGKAVRTHVDDEPGSIVARDEWWLACRLVRAPLEQLSIHPAAVQRNNGARRYEARRNFAGRR